MNQKALNTIQKNNLTAIFMKNHGHGCFDIFWFRIFSPGFMVTSFNQKWDFLFFHKMCHKTKCKQMGSLTSDLEGCCCVFSNTSASAASYKHNTSYGRAEINGKQIEMQPHYTRVGHLRWKSASLLEKLQTSNILLPYHDGTIAMFN